MSLRNISHEDFANIKYLSSYQSEDNINRLSILLGGLSSIKYILNVNILDIKDYCHNNQGVITFLDQIRSRYIKNNYLECISFLDMIIKFKYNPKDITKDRDFNKFKNFDPIDNMNKIKANLESKARKLSPNGVKLKHVLDALIKIDESSEYFYSDKFPSGLLDYTKMRLADDLISYKKYKQRLLDYSEYDIKYSKVLPLILKMQKMTLKEFIDTYMPTEMLELIYDILVCEDYINKWGSHKRGIEGESNVKR